MNTERVYNLYHYLASEHNTTLAEVDNLVGYNVQQIDRILENRLIKNKI